MPDYIPDYNDLYAAHERRRERALRKYPKCCYCEERILDYFMFEINGEYYHEKCLQDGYRRKTEDYMEE